MISDIISGVLIYFIFIVLGASVWCFASIHLWVLIYRPSQNKLKKFFSDLPLSPATLWVVPLRSILGEYLTKLSPIHLTIKMFIMISAFLLGIIPLLVGFYPFLIVLPSDLPNTDKFIAGVFLLLYGFTVIYSMVFGFSLNKR